MTGEQPPEDDPFEQLTLDERFVASAGIAEPSAAQRAQAAARAEREQNLRRLLDDEALQRENWAQANQRFAPGDDWDDPDASPHRHGHGRTVRIVAVVVVLAMILVYAISQFVVGRPPTVTSAPLPSAAASSDGSADGDGTASGGDPSVQVVRPDDWPAPSTEAATTPLGAPPTVPAGGGPHTFLRTQPDGVTPVAYDPCRPVHFVIRPGGPPEGEVLIREAVAAVSAATGLSFVHDGSTDEGPSDDRAPYQPERYGERWAPVLFTWSDPVESPRLGEVTPEAPQADPAGYAGSIAVGYDPGDAGDAGGDGSSAEMVYVTGSVTLDGPDLTQVAEGPDGRARARAIIQHEVAHVVGLGHVEDQAQLMFPTVTPTVTGFNAGDLEGLAAVGRGRCFPEI